RAIQDLQLPRDVAAQLGRRALLDDLLQPPQRLLQDPRRADAERVVAVVPQVAGELRDVEDQLGRGTQTARLGPRSGLLEGGRGDFPGEAGQSRGLDLVALQAVRIPRRPAARSLLEMLDQLLELRRRPAADDGGIAAPRIVQDPERAVVVLPRVAGLGLAAQDETDRVPRPSLRLEPVDQRFRLRPAAGLRRLDPD